MKIAIVTGGNRGLGKSSVLQMAAKGVDVILTYRSNESEAKEVVAALEKMGRKAVALQFDVSKTSTFASFAKSVNDVLGKWGAKKFDYLVNNAGVGFTSPIVEFTEEKFDELVNIHFKGVFFLTQKLLPLMNDGGRIINLSSGLARFSFPGYSVYGSLKAAIDAMTRYMAVELGPRKITVNSVAPGPVATDFSGGMVRDNAQLNQTLASQTPLGRVGEADDIGRLIASLVSEDFAWVSGQRIEASGGMRL